MIQGVWFRAFGSGPWPWRPLRPSPPPHPVTVTDRGVILAGPCTVRYLATLHLQNVIICAVKPDVMATILTQVRHTELWYGAVVRCCGTVLRYGAVVAVVAVAIGMHLVRQPVHTCMLVWQRACCYFLEGNVPCSLPRGPCLTAVFPPSLKNKNKNRLRAYNIPGLCERARSFWCMCMCMCMCMCVQVKESVTSEHLVVSIAAGITITTIASLLAVRNPHHTLHTHHRRPSTAAGSGQLH